MKTRKESFALSSLSLSSASILPCFSHLCSRCLANSLLSTTNQVTPIFDIQFFIGFCMFCGKRKQCDLRLRADEGAAWLLVEPSVTAGAHDVYSHAQLCAAAVRAVRDTTFC